MVEQRYFKGGQTYVWGGANYTKYNKITNNSENHRGKIAARRGFASPIPLP